VSQALFENPKITQLIGNSLDEVKKLEGGRFSCIIHDPPTITLAGELYSGEFYREAYRVLKPNGRMYHYIGDLDSKSGVRTTRGVLRRLAECGFNQVIRKPQAFGVVAYK
jgi:predicted methyltransferase